MDDRSALVDRPTKEDWATGLVKEDGLAIAREDDTGIETLDVSGVEVLG